MYKWLFEGFAYIFIKSKVLVLLINTPILSFHDLSQSSTKSIAIAARFDIFQDNIHHTISFIPVGYYFATYPSLTDINNWCFNISGLSCDSDTTIQRIAVFVPLAVISCPNRYSVIDLKFGKSLVPGQEILEGDNDQYSPLTEICKKFKITGFLYAVRMCVNNAFFIYGIRVE